MALYAGILLFLRRRVPPRQERKQEERRQGRDGQLQRSSPRARDPRSPPFTTHSILRLWRSCIGRGKCLHRAARAARVPASERPTGCGPSAGGSSSSRGSLKVSADGDLAEQGEDEDSDSDDADGDHDLHARGEVFVDLAQRSGREAGENQADALLDEDSDEDQRAAEIHGDGVLPRPGYQQEQERQHVAGAPNQAQPARPT